MNRQRSPINARRMRGFSLIEMVAAFLVFAIGIGVLMQVLAGSMRNTRQSSNYTMAALWAQSKLDVVGVGEPMEAGRSSGRFDDTYSWELDIQQVDPTAIEPPPQQTLNAGNQSAAAAQQNPRTSVANAGLGGGMQASPFDLYQVDLTVYWGGGFGKRPRTATFSTLRAQNPDPNNGMPGAAGFNQGGLPNRPGGTR
ncbi:MAG: prepilin-type N-terminal cleavage/methylation domain-containing protein [Dokdonella sp.]|nr:prepilin-type N-terminal cleavage/methylation domain-containing protein [Dokdonella sp.]